MANPRVHEIIAEYGLESKVVLQHLRDLGEFVKGPSSSIAPPVARRLRQRLEDQGAVSQQPALVLQPEAAAEAAVLLQLVPRSIPELMDLITSNPTKRTLGGRLVQQVAKARRYYYIPADVAPAVATAGRTRNRIFEHDLPAPEGIAAVSQADGSLRVIAWTTLVNRIRTGAMTLHVETRASTPPQSRLIVGPMQVARIDTADGAPFASAGLRELIGVIASIPPRAPASEAPDRRNTGPTGLPPSAQSTSSVNLVYATRNVTNEGRTSPETVTHRDSRWKVQGHWRDQWYASLQTHKRVWIAEHAAGRADAPLVERDLVYVIRPS